MNTLPLEAASFARGAHRSINQRRKYSGAPYEVHLAEVVNILHTHGMRDPHVLATAWLHDTVEDTGVTLDDIRELFGMSVSTLVYWLTDTETPEDGNRAQRKAMSRERLERAPADVQTIKYADLISNTRSIVEHDPNFAKVYLREKRDLLQVMTRGDPHLFDRAHSQLDNAWANLGLGE